MLPMNSSASTCSTRVELEQRDLIAQMVAEIARVDRDRLVVLPLLVLLPAAAGVEPVEQNLLPVDLVAVRLSLLPAARRLRSRLLLLLVLVLRLDHVEERIVEQLLLEVLLEVQQRHVEQIHRLVQAWIDLELLLELRALGETRLHEASLPLRSAREPGAQARRQRGAKIDLGDGVIEHELAHGARHLHLSIEHDVRAVDDVEGLLDVVIADQHADAAMSQVGDDGLNVMNRDRVDAGEWLVQHHELRTA